MRGTERHRRQPLRQRRRDGKQAEGSVFRERALELVEIGADFYRRGWALGTSGNFSIVVSSRPLRLAITPTSLDKGSLTQDRILEIDESAKVICGRGRPSSESVIHLAIVRACGANAVLHTHSVWSTVLSERFAPERGMAIEGYEMLKGLEGVGTHTHREWLPILDNSQDTARVAQTVTETLKQHPAAHGFLLRRHGLYTWGRQLAEAKRHVEILEFLMEVLGRTHAVSH